MSQPSLSNCSCSCSGGSPSVCSIRCVQGNFIPTDDVPASYDFTNMLAWVNGYNLSTVAWGSALVPLVGYAPLKPTE